MPTTPAYTTPLNSDPLAGLRDIHMPEPIGAWPLAPGWWLLIFLALALLAGCTIYCWRYWCRNGYRREAIRKLTVSYLLWETDHNDRNFVESTQLILKRAALSSYPRKNIGALNGKDWTDWLKDSIAKDTTPRNFDALGTVIYMSDSAKTNIHELYETAQYWLNKHQGQKGSTHV